MERFDKYNDALLHKPHEEYFKNEKIYYSKMKMTKIQKLPHANHQKPQTDEKWANKIALQWA